MNYSITVGWWVIPALITVAAWVPAFRYKPTSHWDFGPALLAAFALIMTLLAWLIYTAIGWATA